MIRQLLALFLGCSAALLAETNPKIAQVENGLRDSVAIQGQPQARTNILQKMKEDQIQAVSIAIVQNGKLEWAKAYGPAEVGTQFQAGSVSKPVTAYGALLLVHQGKLNLDEDVNVYLKRWKIPPYSWPEKVTLRRLLSHSAGTSVSGFPGYSAKSPIPTLLQVLEGQSPANTDPIKVTSQPGKEFRYSGGGTTIVQLLIEEVTGQPFALWMQENVLKPLGMHDSSFDQPATHAASGHHRGGDRVEGNWHLYPEKAAAGLWTTPSDLARFLIRMQQEDNPIVHNMLSRQKIDEETTDVGLGLFLEHTGRDLVFEHDGQNEGFISRLYGFAHRGQGVVIMINNDSGQYLMSEITNSVADAYQWPGFQPVERKEVSLDPSLLDRFVGHYIHDDLELEISRKKDRLFLTIKDGPGPIGLHAASAKELFILEDNLTLELTPEKTLILIDGKKHRTELTIKAATFSVLIYSKPLPQAPS